MTKEVCPTCGREVIMAALENQRNGKWTAIPLDEVFGLEDKGSFTLTIDTREAFDILGESLGRLPVAVYEGEPTVLNSWTAHSPSHFLGAH